MGVSFHAARPTGSPADDLKIVEGAVDSGEATAALQRLRNHIEEFGDLHRENWDYVEEAPKSLLTPYGAFGRFREEVAATEGVDLHRMWGFGPSDDLEAYRRLHPDVKIGAIQPGAEAGAKEQWFSENVIQWE